MTTRFGETVVLGVDGGNTKTVALVASGDGTVLGAARAGCADIYGAATPLAAISEIEAAVWEAIERADVQRGSVAAAVCSLAGADWPEDFAFLRRELDDRLKLRAPALVVNDALGGLRAGSPDGTGVAVVLGTGAAIAGRGADSRSWHSGFWFGQGGAAALGQQALGAVTRAELGIDPSTSLTSRMLELYGDRNAESLLHRFTRREPRPPRGAIGLAAPLVLEEAERGDETAIQLTNRLGRTIGEYAVVAARQVGLVSSRSWLVFGGRLLQHRASAFLEAPILVTVRSSWPDVSSVKADVPPAGGAVILALEEAGVQVDESIRARLRESLQSVELAGA